MLLVAASVVIGLVVTRSAEGMACPVEDALFLLLPYAVLFVFALVLRGAARSMEIVLAGTILVTGPVIVFGGLALLSGRGLGGLDGQAGLGLGILLLAPLGAAVLTGLIASSPGAGASRSSRLACGIVDVLISSVCS